MAALYGVPFISLPGLNYCTKGGMQRPKRKFASLHYNWRVHEDISRILLAWMEAFNATKHPAPLPVTPPAAPISTGKLRERFRVCPGELTAYNAYRAAQQPQSSLAPVISDGKWQLAEDRPGKFGWITREPGAIIEFPLRFGVAPRVTVVYIQGYESFGNAKVTMSTHTSKEDYLIFPGTHSSLATQSHAETMNVAQDQVDHDNPGGVAGFGVEPFTNATLRLQFWPSTPRGSNSTSKFVVVHVSSC
jgi:hypothetical protein